MNPAGQQQPVLSLNQLPGRPTLAKEFRSPHFGKLEILRGECGLAAAGGD
jgi:hypothetical protein